MHLPSVAEDSAEEHARLRERSTMEPLRILTDQVVAHPHLPLVAGAVAFDYLGTYESLPSVADGANTCPDYLFLTPASFGGGSPQRLLPASWCLARRRPVKCPDGCAGGGH